MVLVDGVFEEVPGQGDADADVQSSPPGILLHPAGAIDEAAVAQVRADLRRRILRAFVGRGLLESCDAKDRQAYQYSEPGSDKRGAKADELHLTPLELIDRIAALVPPPRTHHHCYFGVLASNSPLIPPKPELATPKWSKAHYLWAVLIARIYEVFPLLCPLCGGQMRLIAFITEGTQIRKILDHIGVDSEPPHIAPARGPPLWGDCDAQTDDGAQIEPADWDLAAQPATDYEIDQRVSW
jgi:hypothetical protein